MANPTLNLGERVTRVETIVDSLVEVIQKLTDKVDKVIDGQNNLSGDMRELKNTNGVVVEKLDRIETRVHDQEIKSMRVEELEEELNSHMRTDDEKKADIKAQRSRWEQFWDGVSSKAILAILTVGLTILSAYLLAVLNLGG